MRAPVLDTIDHAYMEAAEILVGGLPESDYKNNYQPDYDRDELMFAVSKLMRIRSIVTISEVDSLQSELSDIVTGKSDRPIVQLDECHETVEPGTSINLQAARTVESRDIAIRALGNPLVIHRKAPQKAKPRSNEFELLDNGLYVPSYMGDMINGKGHDDRQPDPQRLVDAANDAADLVEHLRQHDSPEPFYVGHEALVLAYEQAMIRRGEDGGEYLLSAHRPWGGYRTNGPLGPHAQLLGRVRNPVAMKIGEKTTREDISDYRRILNPDNMPGKLAFMLRVGPGSDETYEKTKELALAILHEAPESLVEWDIHGTTETIDGQKIRTKENIIREILTTADIFNKVGLSVHGVSLETGHYRDQDPSGEILECIDEPGQKPNRKPLVDPLLNPRQTFEILEAVGPALR